MAVAGESILQRGRDRLIFHVRLLRSLDRAGASKTSQKRERGEAGKNTPRNSLARPGNLGSLSLPRVVRQCVGSGYPRA